MYVYMCAWMCVQTIVWVLRIKLGSALSAHDQLRHLTGLRLKFLQWMSTKYYTTRSPVTIPTIPHLALFHHPHLPWSSLKIPSRSLLPREALAEPLRLETFLPNSHISIPPFSPTALSSRESPCDLLKIVMISMPLTRLSFTSWWDPPFPREFQLLSARAPAVCLPQSPLSTSVWCWGGVQ